MRGLRVPWCPSRDPRLRAALMAPALRPFQSSAPSGAVLLRGGNVRGLPLARLRSSFGVVPQTPLLMSGSVRHNLDPSGRWGGAPSPSPPHRTTSSNMQAPPTCRHTHLCATPSPPRHAHTPTHTRIPWPAPCSAPFHLTWQCTSSQALPRRAG